MILSLTTVTHLKIIQTVVRVLMVTTDFTEKFKLRNGALLAGQGQTLTW
jgi:hypothetical protein